MTTPANKQNINALRSVLFDTIADLRDKKNPMDVARANAICNAAKQLTDLARVEIDHQKITQEPSSLPFLCAEVEEENVLTISGNHKMIPLRNVQEHEIAEKHERIDLPNGEKIIRHVAGGTVTTHRMK